MLSKDFYTNDELILMLVDGYEPWQVLEKLWRKPSGEGTWRECDFCPSEGTRFQCYSGSMICEPTTGFICDECYDEAVHETQANNI
jgi:hypothetical protein